MGLKCGPVDSMSVTGAQPSDWQSTPGEAGLRVWLDESKGRARDRCGSRETQGRVPDPHLNKLPCLPAKQMTALGARMGQACHRKPKRCPRRKTEVLGKLPLPQACNATSPMSLLL